MNPDRKRRAFALAGMAGALAMSGLFSACTTTPGAGTIAAAGAGGGVSPAPAPAVATFTAPGVVVQAENRPLKASAPATPASANARRF